MLYYDPSRGTSPVGFVMRIGPRATSQRVVLLGDLAWTSLHRRTTVKIKLFSTPAKNRKPSFDAFEAEVNAWLADNRYAPLASQLRPGR